MDGWMDMEFYYTDRIVVVVVVVIHSPLFPPCTINPSIIHPCLRDVARVVIFVFVTLGCLPHLVQRVQQKGHAVVVVAEGAGEELLGQSAEKDASGNKKLPAIGEFLKAKIGDYFKSQVGWVAVSSFRLEWIDSEMGGVVAWGLGLGLGLG